MATTPSSAFPFESLYADVLGSKMHYIDVGEGDPILFLHGNPTSSYIWRNIIPHLSGQARCIAPDLIGMGKSDHPDIAYRYDDHYEYLCAFIEGLGLTSKLTLVIQDWGSGLGFRWAADHPDRVRGVAFMEGMVKQMSYADLPGALRVMFPLLRTGPVGWLMIGVANVFLKQLLPDLTHGGLSPEALAYYQSAYPTVKSRKAVRVWPQEVPFEGKPADNAATVQAYIDWLAETDVPMMLLHGDDGVAIKEPEIAWCRENITDLEVVDLGHGKHFLQETHPDAIGRAVSRWLGAVCSRPDDSSAPLRLAPRSSASGAA